ncbi:MAG: hypothetical protein KGZ39_00620 [Simkania sp.]|nr:hypothetical protein [Simkania sp.]
MSTVTKYDFSPINPAEGCRSQSEPPVVKRIKREDRLPDSINVFNTRLTDVTQHQRSKIFSPSLSSSPLSRSSSQSSGCSVHVITDEEPTETRPFVRSATLRTISEEEESEPTRAASPLVVTANKVKESQDLGRYLAVVDKIQGEIEALQEAYKEKNRELRKQSSNLITEIAELSNKKGPLEALIDDLKRQGMVSTPNASSLMKRLRQVENQLTKCQAKQKQVTNQLFWVESEFKRDLSMLEEKMDKAAGWLASQ